MLLFSQWTRLLDLLEVLLQDIGMTFLRLDGSTAVKVSSNFEPLRFRKPISRHLNKI